MKIITIADLKNDIDKYIDIADEEDILVFNNGKPYIKIISALNDKEKILKRLAGSIKLDKPYEEILEERYSKI